MHHTTVHASCINMCALPNYLKLPYLIVLLLLMLKSIFFSLSGPPVHRLFIFSFIKQFDIFTLSSSIYDNAELTGLAGSESGDILMERMHRMDPFQVRKYNQNFPGQGAQPNLSRSGSKTKLPRSGSTTDLSR